MMLYASLNLDAGTNAGSNAGEKTGLKKEFSAQGRSPKQKALKLDASDALALAYYHSRMLEFEERLQKQLQAQVPRTARSTGSSDKEIL